MRIQKVRVEGFRLLQDVEIMLESASTVIVGRNNSGKTSLTDVFDRFTSEHGPRFRLEDFSAGTRSKFLAANKLRQSGGAVEDVLALLPKIVLTLTFSYGIDDPDLGPLSPFVIDLDLENTTVIARVEYSPTLSKLSTLFDVPATDDKIDQDHHFLRSLKETLPKSYTIQVSAIDPTDTNNRRQFDGTASLNALLQCNFVRAQRTLDHAGSGDADVIGKLLSTLFKTASAATAAAGDQALAAQLKSSVESIERDVQGGFDEMLKRLLPAMNVLGFPSLNDTELRPETSLNVEALLSDHTKIFYTGLDGVHLPEGYNGLGTRNLIFMLLQLEAYHKSYRAKVVRPVTHLLFIEEPEAHLHPQMQEVFINQLNAAIGKLSAHYPDEPTWKIQFIISTHSSHVANAAPFEAVRYFLNEPSTTAVARHAKIKDFRKGLSSISQEDQEFLHQYMTLTKCDLYFADKVILVEGATERLLMPKLCRLVDEGLPDGKKLSKQYVTTVEVGGAYAHIFYPLLDYLELRTLVITDLDSVEPIQTTDKNGKEVTKWPKCTVSKGKRTSNMAIREWFRSKQESAETVSSKSVPPQIAPGELIAKTDAEKLRGSRRIAYQIPEVGATSCARSYEDALVLANPRLFNLLSDDDEEGAAWEVAADLQKTDTALRFAIGEERWTVPRYIREGLEWLSEPPPPAAQAPVIGSTGSVKEMEVA